MAQTFFAGAGSNSYVYGPGQIGPKQGIYEVSTTQNASLGSKLMFDDGRVFAYSKANGTAAAGVLVAPDQSVQSVVEVDGKATAAAIGATSVILTDSGTLGSATANQYAGALLQITDDAGEGHQYKIKSNTAAASDAVTFTLYDGLVVALTTATDVAIVGASSNEVVIATAATDYAPVGVTPVAVVDGNYFWRQVDGTALILQDGVVAAGDQLSLSDGVDGAVQVLGGGGTAAADILAEGHVGVALYAGDDTGHVGVKLSL